MTGPGHRNSRLTQAKHRTRTEVGHLHVGRLNRGVPDLPVPDQREPYATGSRAGLTNVESLDAGAPALQHEVSVRTARVAIVVCKKILKKITYNLNANC